MKTETKKMTKSVTKDKKKKVYKIKVKSKKANC